MFIQKPHPEEAEGRLEGLTGVEIFFGGRSLSGTLQHRTEKSVGTG